MLMTKEQAAQIECRVGGTQMSWDDEKQELYQSNKFFACKSEGCAHWRWYRHPRFVGPDGSPWAWKGKPEDGVTEYRVGYCGLAGRPEETDR